MEHAELSLLLDRTINAELLLWAICPTQDIIACCFSDQISCHRLHWQRLWAYQHRVRSLTPTAVVWHPDAKLIGVGFDNGTVVLLDPETGHLQREAKVANCGVTSLSWLEELEGRLPADKVCGASVHAETFGSALPSLAGALTVIVAGDSSGGVTLLTSALSNLASFRVQQHVQGVPMGEAPRILQAVAARSLDYMYVLWESSAQGQRNQGSAVTSPVLSVFDVSLLGKARVELRTLFGTLESAADLVQKCLSLVHQAEGKWRGAMEAVQALRSRLKSLLQDYSTATCPPDEDLDQLERLLILGESACTENVLHHFLTTTLGELGIKRAAKQVDGALELIATNSLPALQELAHSLASVSSSLHSTVLGRFYFDSMSLEASLVQDLRRQSGALLLLSELLRLLVTEFQQRWRKVFAWLLQTARMMNSESIARTGASVDTESILGTLALARAGRLDVNVFETLEPLEELTEHLGWLDGRQIDEQGQTSLKGVLEKLQKLCQRSIDSLPCSLSSQIHAVQHIALPTSNKKYPAASMLLSQTCKDPDTAAVSICCPTASPAADALVVRLDPPQLPASTHKHAIASVQFKLAEDEDVLDMLPLQVKGAWLALLLRRTQNASAASLKLVPLAAAQHKQLPSSGAALEQAVQAESSSVCVDDIEGTTSCSLAVGNYMPPLAVSGSRQVAAVVSGTRRICIYDLEDAV